jgi:hypothetical protein
MPKVKKYIIGVFLCVPGILLIAFAGTPLRDGIAVDSAIPVPIYLIRQSPLPKSVYNQAAMTLDRADPADGDAHLLAVEAALHAGAIPAVEIAAVQNALEHSPANARGWMILSDVTASADRGRSAAALGQSILLSPYDFWLAEPRAERAALLWPSLDKDTRALAMRQTLLLWEAPDLRQKMRLLLTKPQGVALAQYAFKDHQDELRDFNRWLFAERRRHPWRD